MKTTAKVFIIIGMVLGGILIVPIIVGFYALSAIENATTKEELITPGILALLFCNILSGVFILCIDDDELDPASQSNNIQKNNYYDNNYYNNNYYNPTQTTPTNVAGSQTNNTYNVPNNVPNNNQANGFYNNNTGVENTSITVGEEIIDVTQESIKFISSNAMRSFSNTYQKINSLYRGEQAYLSVAEIAVGAINLESLKFSSDKSIYPKGLKILNEIVYDPKNQEQKLMNLYMYVDCMCKIQIDFQNKTGKTISPQGNIIE